LYFQANEEVNKLKKYRELVHEMYTTNQIALLTKKRKKVKWTGEEISEAFTWRYLSPRAYIRMRKKPLLPLPG